ncbi:MAG: TonB-dependent receptor [Saprospiraceae bacterium]|nr:TonB-dependent receptor [Saprospiraceae bacterium]
MLAGPLGYRQAISEGLNLSANAGVVHRSPEINELYSNGLHQGVSGLEEGNPDLKSEKSIKGILSADWNVNDRLQIQALIYDHHIRDFIYLQPLKEFRLTIRGAFPVYEYRQTDARLTGADLLVSYAVQQRLKWIGKYAYVLGRDLTNKIGLVNIPSNTMSHSLSYTLNDWKYFRQSILTLTCR